MKAKTFENIILTVVALIIDINNDVFNIGKELMDSGADELTDGGFWIWDIESMDEFYSVNFRKSLGFKDENDFPSNSDSWQKQINKDDLRIATENFKSCLNDPLNHPYYQEVTYSKKDGSLLYVVCSGLLLKHKGSPKYLIGTHKILSDGK